MSDEHPVAIAMYILYHYHVLTHGHTISTVNITMKRC